MARIPAALRARIEAFDAAGGAPIAGIDVGERFLDLAIIADPRAPELKFVRIDMRPLSSRAVAGLTSAIAHVMPQAGRTTLALVDSPRGPRPPAQPGRAIDAALRGIVGAINQSRSRGPRISTSMFPTPERDYFVRCAQDPRCAPHLAAFAREILGIEQSAHRRLLPRRGGWLFTRFMLSGFAVFRALELLGAEAFESYPYLAFALHNYADERLPAKSDRRSALVARIAILSRLARQAGIRHLPQIASLDQADAAVLALCAAAGAGRGGLITVSAAGEGAFMLAPARRDRAAIEEQMHPRGPCESA